MDIGNNLIKHIEKWGTLFFFSASVFVMFLLLQGLILSWLSQFKIIYLLLSVLISFTLGIIFFHLVKKDINRLPRLSVSVLTIIILICLIGILFPHETFGGRDEGSYSNIAVMLSKNNNLLFSLNIRSAIGNYLGLDTQNIVAVATPAYYVWLAIQNVFFGLQWMLRSNIILVALGLCSLYFVSSLFTKKSLSFIVVILYASCIPFLWFFRETMSENLAFFLLWTSIVFLFTFHKTKRDIYLIGLMLATWLFSFTRLEGFLIQITTFFVFTFILLITKKFSLKRNLIIILVYFIVISSSLLIQKPFNSNSFLRTNFHNVGFLVKRSFSVVRVNENTKQRNETIPKKIKFVDRIPFFSIQMLAKYNLVIVLFSIFLILPLIVIDKKIDKINKIYIIGLFIILLPEFYKFFDPSVTMEQPWMYRRYLYALLPVGYLCFTVLLSRLMSRKFMIFFTVLLFLLNIFLSRNIIFFKNNWSITEQLNKIIKTISPSDDFVVVKEWTILDNYYPTTYLIYHKGMRALVRYMIDEKAWLPEEKKYKGFPYKNLFLLSDKEPDNYKNFKLIKIDSIDVKYKQLQPNCILSSLNSELGLLSTNFYLLPYSDAVTYCSKTDNEILDVEKKIYLYELTNKK